MLFPWTLLSNQNGRGHSIFVYRRISRLFLSSKILVLGSMKGRGARGTNDEGEQASARPEAS